MDNEMERVGRVLAADQGLRVRVQGASAYAKPGEIVIPNLETWDALGQDAKRMLHGLLDHETGHAVLSDFGVAAAIKGDAKEIKRLKLNAAQLKKYGKVLGALDNAIEDGWMEREHGKRWPGAAENMQRKNEWFWNVGQKGSKAIKDRIESCDPIEGFALAVTLITRKSKAYSDFAHVPAVAELLEQCSDLIDSVDGVHSSLEALHVALAICDRLEQLEPEQEPQPEEQQEDESDEQEQGGSGKGESDEEGDEDGQESGKSDSESDESEEGSEDDSDSDAEKTEKGEASETESKPLELAEWKPSGAPLTPEAAIEAALHEVFKEPEDTRPYLVFSHDYDIECDLSNETGSTEQLDHEVRHAVGALIQTFEAGLRARKAVHLVPGSDEGEVDSQMLAAFSLGAANVDEMFMQPVCEDDKNSAVSILVDCSGSMQESRKAELARQAAYAMGQALSSVQIPHEIVGFTCVSSGWERSHPWLVQTSQDIQACVALQQMRAGLLEQEARGVPATAFAREVYQGSNANGDLLTPTYGIFKTFDQIACNGVLNIAGIHENLDGEAVVWAAKRLRQRPEPRRVLIVLSDGRPIGSRNNEQGARYLRESIARAIESGIEVYGIGIMSNAVEDFYPSYVVVNNLDHLSSEAMEMLTQALVTNRLDDVA